MQASRCPDGEKFGFDAFEVHVWHKMGIVDGDGAIGKMTWVQIPRKRRYGWYYRFVGLLLGWGENGGW